MPTWGTINTQIPYLNVLEDAKETVWKGKELHILYDFSNLVENEADDQAFPTPTLLVLNFSIMVTVKFLYIQQLLIPSFKMLKFSTELQVPSG